MVMVVTEYPVMGVVMEQTLYDHYFFLCGNTFLFFAVINHEVAHKSS